MAAKVTLKKRPPYVRKFLLCQNEIYYTSESLLNFGGTAQSTKSCNLVCMYEQRIFAFDGQTFLSKAAVKFGRQKAALGCKICRLGFLHFD